MATDNRGYRVALIEMCGVTFRVRLMRADIAVFNASQHCTGDLWTPLNSLLVISRTRADRRQSVAR